MDNHDGEEFPNHEVIEIDVTPMSAQDVLKRYFKCENLDKNHSLGDLKQASASMKDTFLHCLDGRNVIAQSGSAKFDNIVEDVLRPINASICECQTLILAPNHELAIEVQNVVSVQGEHLNLHSHLSVKGKNVREDANELKAGKHIVVGTPGRVLDMIKRKALKTNNINNFVLEETDKLLHHSFQKDIEPIIKSLPLDSKVILLMPILPPDILENSPLSSSDLNTIMCEIEKINIPKSKKSNDKNKQKKMDVLKYWVLEENKCQLCIKEHDGGKTICIGGYNVQNGNIAPYKNGASLTVDQWKKLGEIVAEVNDLI